MPVGLFLLEGIYLIFQMKAYWKVMETSHFFAGDVWWKMMFLEQLPGRGRADPPRNCLAEVSATCLPRHSAACGQFPQSHLSVAALAQKVTCPGNLSVPDKPGLLVTHLV